MTPDQRLSLLGIQLPGSKFTTGHRLEPEVRSSRHDPASGTRTLAASRDGRRRRSLSRPRFVASSTPTWSFRQLRRFLPFSLELHSPAPKIFKPVRIHDQANRATGLARKLRDLDLPASCSGQSLAIFIEWLAENSPPGLAPSPALISEFEGAPLLFFAIVGLPVSYRKLSGSISNRLIQLAAADVCIVQCFARCSVLYQPKKERQKTRACSKDSNRSGKVEWYFSVLTCDSEKALSLLV